MARLLYIEASPRKKLSNSIDVARSFIETYECTHPDDQVDILDLWDLKIPEFTGDVIDAKYVILHGLSHSMQQEEAWSVVEKLIADFKSADKYLFSLPMWNFSIPYKLKHYIDLIVQPGYTFNVTAEGGYEGLVTGRPAALIYARGGAYPSGTSAENLDYQKPYMELALGFMGFKDIQTVVVEPTLGGTAEEQNEVVDAARKRAREVAAVF